MIEVILGSLEAQILQILQKKYPITIEDLARLLPVSRARIEHELQKMQVRGLVRIQPLPDKTYLRLLRNDFSFIGKKHQQQKKTEEKQPNNPSEEYDGIMYT